MLIAQKTQQEREGKGDREEDNLEQSPWQSTVRTYRVIVMNIMATDGSRVSVSLGVCLRTCDTIIMIRLDAWAKQSKRAEQRSLCTLCSHYKSSTFLQFLAQLNRIRVVLAVAVVVLVAVSVKCICICKCICSLHRPLT